MRSQFRAVKEEKQTLNSNPTKAIIHMDWSTNFIIKQARSTQSHYFYDHQFSLHPMVIWHQAGSSSICTFSDAKKHKACHLWAGLYPFIKELMQEGYLEFVFISDSPTKQYRNRFVAALLEELADKNCEDLQFKWIWLEAGHGKGAADGVGASVKQKLKMITGRQNEVGWTAQELKARYHEAQGNVRVTLYSEGDANKVKLSPID